MRKIKNVMLVLRTGGDFNFHDVELISFHIKNKATQPINVYCLYDKVDTIMKLKNCTLLPMEYKQWPGWWSKMNMFNPKLEKYRPFLYLDLDTAIVGDIVPLFDRNDTDFIGLEDFYRPNKFASGVMWLPVNSQLMLKIWTTWLLAPEKYMKQLRGDQDFLRNFNHFSVLWQRVTNMICSFKVRGKERTWLMDIPENITIVCFHGKPRIWDAAMRRVIWVWNYVYER